MMCRFVCGEGAGLHSGEAEESRWRVNPDPAGEVFYTSKKHTHISASNPEAYTESYIEHSPLIVLIVSKIRFCMI